MVTEHEKRRYEEQGYHVARGLFPAEEARKLREHYMALRAEGPKPGDSAGVDIGSDDPLKRYPRMIHMHRWDDVSLRWLLDRRIAETLRGLLDQEAIAAQTMIYFKPPQARGQAMHQDQFYLRVQPGTCIAAWMPLESCDEENGCLRVVPGSHRWPLLCTEKADVSLSFTDVTVPVPPGTVVEPVVMEAGDVLFFNGQVVHGSGPNRSATRFRRALIGHYVAGNARKVAKFFKPALRMDGSVVENLEESEGGGSCGTWVDRNGRPAIEMVGSATPGKPGPAT